jgi:hypothetical protein
MTVWLTANEMGAFVSHSITDSALSTQLYLAVAALTTLCLAAIVDERGAARSTSPRPSGAQASGLPRSGTASRGTSTIPSRSRSSRQAPPAGRPSAR